MLVIYHSTLWIISPVPFFPMILLIIIIYFSFFYELAEKYYDCTGSSLQLPKDQAKKMKVESQVFAFFGLLIAFLFRFNISFQTHLNFHFYNFLISFSSFISYSIVLGLKNSRISLNLTIYCFLNYCFGQVN